MTAKRAVLGTRGSVLAVRQTESVVEHLQRSGWEIQLRHYTTSGDKWLQGPLEQLTGSGFFTRELENDLLNGTLDLVVHSLKDVALLRPEGIITACIPAREDPSDWLVMRLDAPDHPRIGTSSVRRERMLRQAFPDASFTWIRGNVPTRVQHVREGALRGEPLHGTVLAAAGLVRLGLDLTGLAVRALTWDELLPAPGQGALLVETHARREDLVEALATLHDPTTERRVTLERRVLEGLGGGCQQPLGALAELRSDGAIELRAAFATETEVIRAIGEGEDTAALQAVLATFRAAGFP